MTQEQAKSLRIQSYVLLAMLVLQYALGMYANLFIQFPQDASGGQLWEFSWSQAVIATHIVLGILLFVGAVALCIRAYRAQNPTWRTTALIGLIAILIAGLGGVNFIPSQTAVYSYVMSLAFLAAFFSYGWGLYASLRQ